MNVNYVQLPGRDDAQIDQIVTEYQNEPAKGLAHGVQKDAIQNGFGARLIKDEAQACREWSFHFELIKVKGEYALVFWDEATFGLTGQIMNTSEINQHFLELGPEERYARFSSKFASGDNIGAGSFGRGKLIFTGASKTRSILINSLRSTDNVYLAFDRRLEQTQIVQPDQPYINAEAEKFMREQTGCVLKPLAKPGTRVTILNVNDELVEAVKRSFSKKDYIYKASLASMIEETWWELLHKFDAKIYITQEKESKRVELGGVMGKIAEVEDGEEDLKVYVKKNIPVNLGPVQHRIKEMKFVVMPSNIDEQYNEIWIQRKRMKVGSVSRRITSINPRIAKRLSGYVILEPELEDIIEKAEGTTHYGFNLKHAGIRHVADKIKAELNAFQSQLGLLEVVHGGNHRRELMDALSELNQMAPSLGLITQYGDGTSSKEVSILLKSIQLPDSGSLRVEMGDIVGPAIYELINRTDSAIAGTIVFSAKQAGKEAVVLSSCHVVLGPKEVTNIELSPFELNAETYSNYQTVKIEAVLKDDERAIASSTRILYLGVDPDLDEPPIKLSVNCKFPRKNTRRVNRTEVISDIVVKVTNLTVYELEIGISLSFRQLENTNTGRPSIPLFSMIESRAEVLNPYGDCEIVVGNIAVDEEKFSSVLNSDISLAERTCDIFTKVVLLKGLSELNLPRLTRLDKSVIKFYLEIDPPGQSIFSDVRHIDAPDDPRTSWTNVRSDAEGIIFYINVGHPNYKFWGSFGDEKIIGRYFKEQMLTQAFIVSIKNSNYRGVIENFKDALTDPGASPIDAVETFNVLIGSSLMKLAG